MKKLVLVHAAVRSVVASADTRNQDAAAWEAHVQNVTIIRDDWAFRTSTERRMPTRCSA